MSAWWVELEGRAICLEGDGDEVKTRAEAMGKVLRISCLPYPAEPRVAPSSNCPSFCWRPQECKGKTSCPRPYACSE
jgi:hypothetical protein